VIEAWKDFGSDRFNSRTVPSHCLLTAYPSFFRLPHASPLFLFPIPKVSACRSATITVTVRCKARTPPFSKFCHMKSHHVPRVAALRKSIRKKSSRHLLLNLRILHRASGALGILHLGQYFHVAVRPAKTSGAERFPKSYSAWWLNSSACRWRWRWVLPKFRGLELRSSIEPVASLTLGQEVKCNRHPFETKSHRTIEYSTKSQIFPT
jgi:hypothetical protein